MKKKWLIGFLAASMALTVSLGIAACGKSGKNNDEEIATSAIEQIKALYKNTPDSDSKYEVTGQVRGSDQTLYDVTWTAVATTQGIDIDDYVSVGEMDATSKSITITLTMGEQAVEFDLQASVTVGKVTKTTKFSHKLNAKPSDAKGTKDDPYSTRKVIEIASGLGTVGSYYYSEADKGKDVPTRVWVKGYIIDCGNGTQFAPNAVGWIYIAESKDSTKDSPDALCLYRVEYDEENLTCFEDLAVGKEIMVNGFIEWYQGKNDSAPYAEIASFKTSDGFEDVYCDYLEKEERTPQQNVELALSKVDDTMTFNTAEDHALPESTIPGVTFTWSTTDSTYTISENKLHVATLPTSDARITATVTATVEGATVTDNTKDVTVTIKAPVQQEEGTLLLTTDTLFVGLSQENSYSKFNGTHTVGTATVTTSQVMISTNEGYPGAIQFQGSSTNHGYLSVNGTFTEVVIVLRTSYDLVKPTVTLNGTEVTGTADEGVADGTIVNNEKTFTVNKYTITYTLTGTGEVKITNSDTHAMYISSITLTGTPTSGGTVTPGPDEPTDTFTAIESPVAGTDYYLAMTKTDGTVCYFNGSKTDNGYYLATTTNVSEAVKVALEADGEGWVIKYGSKYIEMVVSTNSSGTHVNATISDTKNGTWTWNTTYKFFTWEINDDTYALGAFGTSSNIGTSASKYFTNTSNYFGKLGTVSNGTQGGGTEEPDPEITLDHKGTADDPYSVKDALAATKALEDNGYSAEIVYVTGYVASIKNKPSTQYPNWNQVVLVDEKDGDAKDGFTVYRIYPNESTDLKLWDDLSVGSKITVKGYLNKYVKGSTVTPEMNDKGDTKIETVSYEDARSAVEKANDAIKGAKEILESTYENGIVGATVTEIELPASAVTGVTLNYTASVGVITDGKLPITHSEDETSLTIDIEAEGGTKETVSLTIVAVIPLPAGDYEANLDFTKTYATYAKDWSGYTERDLDFATLEGASETATKLEGNVVLSSATKQASGQAIDDRPVLVAKSSATAYITVTVSNANITSVKFILKAWGDNKKFSKIVIETTIDGEVWTEVADTAVTGSTTFAIVDTGEKANNVFELTGIAANVKAVRLSVAATSTSNQQFGLTSVEIKANVPAPATVQAPAEVAVLPEKKN